MLDSLLNLADPWGYVIVALLVAGEAAAFVGLVLPGETAAFLGGVLAYEGQVDLRIMLIVVCAAAIVGDSIGYEVGRGLGPRLRNGRLGRLVGQQRWDRASAFMRRHGGRAVFLGRWIGVLRALVPSLAGASGIPYRTFLLFNVLGGVTWASTFVVLGYVAGSSWRQVEGVMGQATAVVVGLVVFIGLLVILSRWVSSHRETIAAKRDEFLERPFIAGQRARFKRQIDFVERRLDPGGQFGLYLTLGLLVGVIGAYAFGAVLQDVVAHDELALVDRPITLWLVHHRSAWLDQTMEVVTFFGSAPFVITTAAAASGAAWFTTRSARWPALFILGAGGAELLFNLVKSLVGRPRPEIQPLIAAPGFSFPSGHTMSATVLFGALAYLLTRGRGAKTSVWIWMGAATAACLVALSRVYLGAHWFTDVLGALFLGTFWLIVSILTTTLLERPGGDGSVALDDDDAPKEGRQLAGERAS